MEPLSVWCARASTRAVETDLDRHRRFRWHQPVHFFNFIHRAPDGCTLTSESLLKNVMPFNTMSMAMGLHPRVGNEDTIIDHKGDRFGSVAQIKQTVRIAHELGRDIATGKEAREIYRIGVQYQSIEETLLANGMAPNRKAGQKGVPQRG